MKVRTMYLPRLAIILVACVSAPQAYAHEFWLEAQKYQVEPGETLAVDLRNGEQFKGNALSYFPSNTTRFEMVLDGDVTSIQPRMGDAPALQAAAPEDEGLLVILHEAAPSTVTYTEWQKFINFAEHKDFPTVIEDHVAAGYPQDRFKETYTRHSKALIAVGSGAGADRSFGLATELIALTNPYRPNFDGQMQVRVTYQDAPRAGAQIEVYERHGDAPVTITKHRTDARGIASFGVSPGGTYLVDAVVLRPATPQASDPNRPLWETLWASLTFAVPQ
jgi:cobalt/nickel transport protein